MGSHRRYVRGHIWWLGLKYVTSQRTFCGLYVGILTSSLKCEVVAHVSLTDLHDVLSDDEDPVRLVVLTELDVSDVKDGGEQRQDHVDLLREDEQ